MKKAKRKHIKIETSELKPAVILKNSMVMKEILMFNTKAERKHFMSYISKKGKEFFGAEECDIWIRQK